MNRLTFLYNIYLQSLVSLNKVGMTGKMNENRYSRQVLFSPINQMVQIKLEVNSVLVVDVGALGIVISNHLVCSGIVKIRMVDRDYVEMSNLQR